MTDCTRVDPPNYPIKITVPRRDIAELRDRLKAALEPSVEFSSDQTEMMKRAYDYRTVLINACLDDIRAWGIDD